MRRKHILIVLAALLMVVALATTLASAEKLTRGGSEQQPEIGPTPAAPGFYLVGSKKLDPSSFHQSGDMQFFTWAELNPADGVYNFGRIDQFISDHYIASGPNQPGRLTAFSITPLDGRTGDGALAMPAWVRARPNTTINGALTEQILDSTFASNNLNAWWDTSGPVSASSINPHGGTYAAMMGDQPGTTAELQSPTIRIPNVLAQGQISYWWRSTSSDGVPDPDDRLIVEILDGSSVLVQVQSQANLGTQGWQQSTLDLRPYDGHWSTVRFRLINDNDASVTAVWIDDVSLTVQPILAKFWDNAYLVPYNAFVQALGSEFRNESRLDFVGMGTGEWGETRASDNEDDPATLAAGLDSQGWIATVNQITDMYVSAFSEGGRLRKTVMLQNAPFQYQPYERRDFSAYAATKDAGLSFNGLFYEWNNAITYPYPNAGGAWRLKAYDPIIEYGGSVPIGFETYNYMVGTATSQGTGISDTFYWAVLNALDKHATYLRMSNYAGWFLGANDQPVPAYTDIMAWAKPYFGASLRTPLGRDSQNRCGWRCATTCSRSATTTVPTTAKTPPAGPTSATSSSGSTRRIRSRASKGVRPSLRPINSTSTPHCTVCSRRSWVSARRDRRAQSAIRVSRTCTIRNCPRYAKASSSAELTRQPTTRTCGSTSTTRTPTMTWVTRRRSPSRTGTEERISFSFNTNSFSGPKYATPQGSSNPWVQKTGSNEFRKAIFRVNDAHFANGLARELTSS